MQILGASLYNVNDTAYQVSGLCYLARSRIREIQVNPQKSREIRLKSYQISTCRYNTFETSRLLGLFNCRKHFFFSLATKNSGTSHDVKSFPIGSFLESFVVKIANDYLC